jgi:hypothetical protein
MPTQINFAAFCSLSKVATRYFLQSNVAISQIERESCYEDYLCNFFKKVFWNAICSLFFHAEFG